MRLRVSTLRAHRFIRIGPSLRRYFFPDWLFVLDSRRLWFTTFDEGGGRERLYRTSDAGKTWHWTPVAGHAMAAGSTDALWFTDPTRLAHRHPTDRAERDAVRHQRRRPQLACCRRLPTGRPLAALPTLGPVVHRPDRTTASDAAPSYYSVTALYVTRDRGESWRAALKARHHSFTTPGV